MGDKPEISHEDTITVAPAISNLPAQEPKAYSEGVCAVSADFDPEKWSYEAVVERSRVRPWRMEKLKMAEQWRENPGIDFPMKCWQDDPASEDCDREIANEVSAVGVGGGWGVGEVGGVKITLSHNSVQLK
nr:hypothetical protein [Nostoc sp. ChiSLP01]